MSKKAVLGGTSSLEIVYMKYLPLYSHYASSHTSPSAPLHSGWQSRCTSDIVRFDLGQKEKTDCSFYLEVPQFNSMHNFM